MPDPQVLYIVAGLVFLGLAIWVVVVLASPGEKAVTAGGPGPVAPARPRESARPKEETPPPTAVDLPKTKPWLQSYAEIQDAPEAPEAEEGGGTISLEIDEEDEPTGPHALILVTAVGRTDPGLKRKHNEDAYAILEDHHLFVIADGMGRHAAGEVASRLCVEAIVEAFQTSDFGPVVQPRLPKRAARLRGATIKANARILSAARENEAYEGMGTTVVSIYFSPNNQRVYIAHVGDSRCYRLRGGKLVQLTTDHTLGAAGIQGKTANILSRAVGIEDVVDIDIAIESPQPGDIYLLCSDGLSRMVAADEIQSTLASTGDLDAATKTLIDMANRGGGRDNITTILVRVEKAKLPA
jgi:protein phosphatase